MKLEISAISDKGCVREHNEDMVLIGEDIFRDNSRQLVIDLNNNQKLFIAVADGMGGHNAGEIASEIVLQKMISKINLLEANLSEKELSERISEWAKEIHYYILDEGNKDLNKKGMGSTLIGVLFYNDKAYYINVGDSRLYRFRNGNLMQISKDHSLREVTGNKNIPSYIILSSFGGGEKISVDFAPVGGKIIDGDCLLLCSDGLSDMLPDSEIEDILNNEKENQIMRLLTETKNKGGKDNITIALIHINTDVTSADTQISQCEK
jgi:protein phosphatase